MDFYNKKNLLVIILVILGIFLIGFYFNEDQHQLDNAGIQKLENNEEFIYKEKYLQDKANKEFISDMLLIYKKYYDIGAFIHKELGSEYTDFKAWKILSRVKGEIFDMKLIVSRWIDDSDEVKKNIATSILYQLENWDQYHNYVAKALSYEKDDPYASELYMDVAKKYFNEAAKGLKTLPFLMREIDKLELTPSSKQFIINKIDSIFKQAIKDYKENKNSSPIIKEVIFIRNKYAEDLKLPKI